MPSLRLDLATPADDAELRRLLRDNPMSGNLTVAFEREPSFFDAARIEGSRQDVIAVRDRAVAGRVLGTATRSVRPMWLGGEVRELGYLSGLRLDPVVRSSTALARGYKLLGELHRADPVPLYLSTIIEDNRDAIRVLTSGRAGLPIYRDVGRLRTHSISLLRRRRRPARGVEILRGSEALLPEIAACLARSGARHPFTPALTERDLAPGSPSVPGLTPGDFFVARRDGRVIGTVARWDQGAFKQTVVVAYRGTMRLARPIHGLLARIGGFAPLPTPGARFKYFYAAFPAVDDDDPAVFRALLEALHDDSLGGRWSFFMLGLHERDPLNAALSGFRFIPYDARLYGVHWPGDESALTRLGAQVPRPEISVL